mgnify:CR=1 FL=1
MKNEDFNIWHDIFGYHDMDFDGDIDFEDVALEDDIFDETEQIIHPNIPFDFDDDDEDDDY